MLTEAITAQSAEVFVEPALRTFSYRRSRKHPVVSFVASPANMQSHTACYHRYDEHHNRYYPEVSSMVCIRDFGEVPYFSVVGTAIRWQRRHKRHFWCQRYVCYIVDA